MKIRHPHYRPIHVRVFQKKHMIFYAGYALILFGLLTYYTVQLNDVKRLAASVAAQRTVAAQNTPQPPMQDVWYPKQTDQSNWSTYTNTLAGYTLRIPKDWQISEESFEDPSPKATATTGMIDIYPGGIQKDFLFKLTIEAIPDSLSNGPDPDPEKNWNTIQSNYKSWNLKDKTIKDVTINGSQYTMIEGTSMDGGVPNGFLSRVYLRKINKNKGTFAVIIRDSGAKKSELFSQIAESIRFN